MSRPLLIPIFLLLGVVLCSCETSVTAQVRFDCPLLGPAEIRRPDTCARQGGRFDARRGADRIHGALDLNAPLGSPVLAVAAGRAAVASENWGAMGHTVILDHRNGWYSIYGHLARIDIAHNETVRRGQGIGGVGYSGNAECLRRHSLSPHLHFAVVRLDRPGVADWPRPITQMRQYGAVLNALASSSGGYGLQDPEQVLRGQNCW